MFAAVSKYIYIGPWLPVNRNYCLNIFAVGEEKERERDGGGGGGGVKYLGANHLFL